MKLLLNFSGYCIFFQEKSFGCLRPYLFISYFCYYTVVDDSLLGNLYLWVNRYSFAVFSFGSGLSTCFSNGNLVFVCNE